MTQPWPQPAGPDISQALTHALLERIKEDIPSLTLSDQQRQTIADEYSPWLALWATPEHEEMLMDLTQDLVHEIKQYGQDQTLTLLQEHALAARIGFIDRWIKQATQKSARDEQVRASFTAQAEELDQKLNALDDSIAQQNPSLRQAFADQLSEMYLDLEFLISGIPGSLRHQYLFTPSGGDL